MQSSHSLNTEEELASLAKEKFKLELLISALIALQNCDDVIADADKMKAHYDKLKNTNPRETKMLDELNNLRVAYYNERHYKKMLQYPDKIVDLQQETKNAYKNGIKLAIKNVREQIDETKRKIARCRNQILANETKLAINESASGAGFSYIRIPG